jgi:hypothetical protein
MGKVLELKQKILRYHYRRKEAKFQAFVKKCCFLYEQAFRFYYDFHTIRIGDSVDFFPSKYARPDAVEALLRIIDSGRVNQSYTSRVNELKKQGRLKEIARCRK